MCFIFLMNNYFKAFDASLTKGPNKSGKGLFNHNRRHMEEVIVSNLLYTRSD